MNKGLSRRRIVLNGQDIEYELQRKQVKNINLRIRQDGTVYVSASPTVSLTVIEKFMQSRSGLILSAIEGAKLAQRPLNDPAGESITVLGRELPVTVVQGAGGGVEQKNGRLYVTLKDILTAVSAGSWYKNIWMGCARRFSVRYWTECIRLYGAGA